MSEATLTAGAVAPVQSKKVGWFGTVVILVVLFIGTGYIIEKTHKPTPIKNAIAGLISSIKYIAMIIAGGAILDEPGDAPFEVNCQCEVQADGTATAEVNGQKVPALNHEFGS